MEAIIRQVIDSIARAGLVEVEISARHVHLSEQALQALFGDGSVLTPKRPLSQPGQYLCEQRVTLIGPKGKKENVAVLGPTRPDTQVELSRSDCIALGVFAPFRESGDVAGSGGITLQGPCGILEIKQGVIVAKNHVHLPPAVAKELGLRDKQQVSVEVLTERPVVFKNVIIRVNENFNFRMHIDFDEANAAGCNGFTLGKIIL